ncbi:MAG: dienelactone hydrolase family protein [Candidatus Bathyarchaeia archaeon]|jgi:pimeloyl-ACP methyl ester carboxylesterase
MFETTISPIRIPVTRNAAIEGNLTIPPNATAVITFAHGSGSSRFSPRNQYVAKTFNDNGLATLLIDLLTDKEEEIDMSTAEYRFNINLLAERLMAATEWLKLDPSTRNMAFGYFGASTGAAAALIAAAKLGGDIKAVVSRGGRPDLAGDFLGQVRAPTLLLVGGDDTEVIELNRQAADLMQADKKLVIIPGATHLFEEPGKLDEVAEFSVDWFKRYLR